MQYEKYIPNPLELAQTIIDENYIIATQMPSYSSDTSFLNQYILKSKSHSHLSKPNNK